MVTQVKILYVVLAVLLIAGVATAKFYKDRSEALAGMVLSLSSTLMRQCSQEDSPTKTDEPTIGIKILGATRMPEWKVTENTILVPGK